MSEVRPIDVKHNSSDFRSLAWNCQACRWRLLFFLFLPLIVILIDEYALTDAGEVNGSMLIGALALGSLLSAIFLLVIPSLQVRAQHKAGFVEPYRISLRGDGVSAEHPRQDNLYRWSGLHDVSATEDRLFLYTAPGCAVIIPKRSFESEAAFDQWCDEAQRRWTASKAVE